MNIKLRNTVLIIASVITVICVIIGTMGVTQKVSNIFGGISFGKTVATDSQSLDGDVKEIHLNLDLSDIVIEKGTENTISISSNKTSNPNMTFENGVLTVDCKEKVKITPFSSAATDVVITVSDDVDIIDVTCSAGDFEVSDIKAATFSSSIDMGDVEIRNCIFEDMSIEDDLGDVEVRNVSFDNGSIVSAAGDVDIELPSSGKDVAFDVAVELGDVTIGGKEVNNHYTTTDGTKKLSVSLDMGDLDIKY